MSEQERIDQEHPGTDDLERRLAAYAQARLSPDRFASSRMRRHVLEAAHAQDRLATPGWRLIPLRRRLSALALAATLTLVGAAAVSAGAMPGGPLYGARLWLGQITLPSDAAAREQARLTAIDQRLSEADAAARTGDAPAVSAALKAYSEAVEAALRDAGADPDRLARLQAILAGQLAHLETIEAAIPAQSDRALVQAIDRASQALDEARQRQQAAPTPKPGKTPGADSTPKPTRTPATPDHTPAGHSSESPTP